MRALTQFEGQVEFILLPFLSVALQESGTKNAFLGPCLNNNEIYLTPLLVLKITRLQDECIY
jgi:hypothetical protein